jgi:hypothetical protein
MDRPILPVISVADRISAVVLGMLLVVAVDAKVCGNNIISLPGPDLPSRSSAPPSSSRLQDSGSSAPPPPKLVLAPSPINAARFSRSRLQAALMLQALLRRPRLPPGHRLGAPLSTSGNDNTSILRSPGVRFLDGSVDPLQPLLCTAFHPTVVSTVFRRRGRRRSPSCSSWCSYPVFRPSCISFLLEGLICNLAALLLIYCSCHKKNIAVFSCMPGARASLRGSLFFHVGFSSPFLANDVQE